MADCGCRITGLVTTPDGQNHHMIEYCPLHKAAPELYGAAKIGLDLAKNNVFQHPFDDTAQIYERIIKKALAKVG